MYFCEIVFDGATFHSGLQRSNTGPGRGSSNQSAPFPQSLATPRLFPSQERVSEAFPAKEFKESLDIGLCSYIFLLSILIKDFN